MECEVFVTLQSKTPVVGCEINPDVRVKGQGSGILKAPQHSLVFNWYREQITCSVHHAKLAAVQCISCVTLNIPVEESYHCSTSCFLDAWKKHLVRHRHAAEVISKNLTGKQKSATELRSSGSWPGSLFDQGVMMVECEGRVWVEVGSLKTYVPTMDDFGFRLRLDSAAVDRFHFPLSKINTIVTDPVILHPRCMIPIRHLQKPWNSNLKDESSNEVVFSVLSYNILADLYATTGVEFTYCPTEALVWGYRRQNLLREIIEYDADILCLQEVQSDHFENFFKPKLENCGYSVLYKKKKREIYMAKYVIDGCAIFYRRDLFKAIKTYEVEFDQRALPLVKALDPTLKKQGSFRLMKDNVALVVVLEKLHNSSTSDALQSRICVATTHIHANPKCPDVKLFQVANLVNGLETIAQSQIPLLLCGDFNSLPGSDPHIFIVKGETNPIRDGAKDPLDIYQHLKLRHSLPLVSAYASFFHPERVEEQLRKMHHISEEPVFTNFTADFCGTLDYIFYTENSLRVEGLLELLDKQTLGTGLPSVQFSSDHIALMASFRLIQPPPANPPPLPVNPWPTDST
ncbi:carbon catabolite repressor protein 4 homolog 1-like [Corylus avellana]|uniref:carbon catabolite repressor protein 4 homolog 1-like n=1 Tax=Corylus avellana TaxID=13451 RepID=UPI00286C40E5|nr:carbon catabolite repressor protein 4 homolog 1-like [Corylus avellana]